MTTGNPMPPWVEPTLWTLAIGAWFLVAVFVGYVLYTKVRHRNEWKTRQPHPGQGTDPAAQMPAAAEEPPIYDDWLARFVTLVDHAGTIARCSPAPALVNAGLTLDSWRQEVDQLRSVWKVKSWPEDRLHIEGVRRAFEAVGLVLSLAATTFADEFHDDEHRILETSWSASTFDLMDELADLKAAFQERVPAYGPLQR